MKAFIAALIGAVFAFAACEAHAKEGALVCLFKPTGERFNLVTMDGADYIQWGTGKFEGVVSKFENPYLTVTLYGQFGTFRMVYDAPKGVGYGGVVRFDGKEVEGEILCARP